MADSNPSKVLVVFQDVPDVPAVSDVSAIPADRDVSAALADRDVAAAGAGSSTYPAAQSF